MNEIRFRIWNGVEMYYCSPEYLGEYYFGIGKGVDFNPKDESSDPKKWVWLLDTGFKNKKGVELYQGCIIHYTKHKGYLLESFIGEVIWMKEEGCWGYRTSGYDYAFNSANEIQYDILDHIEVIGNIYENPELLS